ncbi:T9SS type A sorting domain-containing protein [Spirosoma sp. HMF3257]|uniref:T9SS C-terminal target domain-containing protein n=1 Tax=Spirosoma telluris TaxID=2183553 RepID=A0A327NRZ3_9BACT|nr:T9SS type A sorting domain-containing protein [Spirosoma telluris]RAI77219.1 T9SS C-terminal target domain-containing protein [Spirosoma telluris]
MKTFLLLLITFLTSQLAQASHLIGGYVQVKPVAGATLTYEVTATLYMNEGSGKQASDQADSFTICFGDGTSSIAYRQSRVYMADRATSVNSYTVIHTYPAPNTYTVLVTVPNRTIVKNIVNADSQPFTLTTTFTTNIARANQTPTPGFPSSTFRAGVNQRLTLDFKATDAEGDSLLYNLAKSSTSTSSCSNQSVTSYQFPNDVARKGTFKLNNRSGKLVWDTPTEVGNYSIAVTIQEYRNGLLISQTTQEITLTVDDLPSSPTPIPPYEPARVEFDYIVTGTAPYADSDLTLTTFPSPVDDRLQVIIQTSNPTRAAVELLDVNGRKLHELTFNQAARQHEQLINMDSLKPGIYLIRAIIDNRSLSRKIVKR